LALFNQFNQEVEAFVAGSNSRSALNDVRFQIQPGSYRMILTIPVILAGLLEPDLKKLERQDVLEEIDPKRADVLKKWQKRARGDFSYSVAINSPEHVFKDIRISRDSDFRTADADAWIFVEKYLVGKVMEIGGSSTVNVHIQDQETNRLILAESSEEFLHQQKENYLYHKLQVLVSGKQNIKTGVLKDVKLLSFLGKAPSYDESELEAAIDKGTKAWAGVGKGSEWVRSLRGGENE